MHVIEFFDKGAEIDPDRAFLVDGDIRRSFGQVQALSHRIANAFRREKIAPGTRAAVYSHNAARAFECVIGLLRSGCVWVPVNVRNTIEETVYILDHTEAEVLFYSNQFSKAVADILARCPRIKHVVCVEDRDPPHASLEDFIAGEAEVSPLVLRSRDDLATLFFSGGTTGMPKGVMMPHMSWEIMIANSMQLVRTPHPVHLVAAPMTHAAGGSALVMAPMGTTNILLPGFEPVQVMQAIQEHRVTHIFLPPTAIYRMLSHPDVRNYDYSSLRYFTYSSAPIPPEKVKEAMDVFGPVMTNSFGQTEVGILGTYFSPEDHVKFLEAGDDRRFRSVGKASLFMQVEIMDDEGNILPPETPGEIVMRGDQIMQGYYKNDEETARAQAFGWHHSGDIGLKDAEGWLYLVDRKRDVIISGGFNIFPSEIEKILLAHPAVQDCAVIGAPHDDWGEQVTAVIEVKKGQVLTEVEINTFCRERLSSYKSPKAFHFWDEVPRSPVGKVLRRKVRDHFWAGRDRKI
ncbi:MAG: AMP-binding protein [Caulobacteraceae bacterium]